MLPRRHRIRNPLASIADDELRLRLRLVVDHMLAAILFPLFLQRRELTLPLWIPFAAVEDLYDVEVLLCSRHRVESVRGALEPVVALAVILLDVSKRHCREDGVASVGVPPERRAGRPVAKAALCEGGGPLSFLGAPGQPIELGVAVGIDADHFIRCQVVAALCQLAHQHHVVTARRQRTRDAIRLVQPGHATGQDAASIDGVL
mmetsp:Transcript_54270/g.149552  ORF Transcript_54270/g.149552 Transcript_54270/m.149552 type:complete len:204 (-) Transcript_54270:1162-1773(-)